jgi:uncharacterized protein YqjF (DUF2071 family)
VRPLVPSSLQIDTYDGTAWVGVVPFRMSHVHPRFAPSVPWLSAFPELNVRTYVTFENKPGIWFFSLDASNQIAVRLARWTTHLAYFNARMKTWREGIDTCYQSRRAHRNIRHGEFKAKYRPTGNVFFTKEGTLEHFLTARYCFYSADRQRRIYRGEISHLPWPLQPAEIDVEVNTVAHSDGIRLPDVPPLLHYAERLDVVAWWREQRL